MTNGDMILLAASELEEGSNERYTMGQLAVQAWNKYPAEFSLTSSASHPDTTKVIAAVIAKNGLLSKNFLASDGKWYKLTGTGHERVRALDKPVVQKGLTASQAKMMERLLTSNAYAKTKVSKDKLTNSDAMDYLGVSDNSRAVDAAIERQQRFFDEIEMVLDEIKAVKVGSEMVEPKTVRFLRNVADLCCGKLRHWLDRACA